MPKTPTPVFPTDYAPFVWASSLSKNQKSVLFRMLAAPVAEDGFTYVAVGAIARDTSISANGVRRCLKALRRRGVISVYDDGDWSGHAWKYIIHLDAIPVVEAA